MRKTTSAFEKGRSAYYKGVKRNPTDDDIFIMEYLQNIVADENGSVKDKKNEAIADWKSGWDDAKAAAEKPIEVPKKKSSKKKSKK